MLASIFRTKTKNICTLHINQCTPFWPPSFNLFRSDADNFVVATNNQRRSGVESPRPKNDSIGELDRNMQSFAESYKMRSSGSLGLVASSKMGGGNRRNNRSSYSFVSLANSKYSLFNDKKYLDTQFLGFSQQQSQTDSDGKKNSAQNLEGGKGRGCEQTAETTMPSLISAKPIEPSSTNTIPCKINNCFYDSVNLSHLAGLNPPSQQVPMAYAPSSSQRLSTAAQNGFLNSSGCSSSLPFSSSSTQA